MERILAMKYYLAIAAFFIAVASVGGGRIERAARAFIVNPQAVASPAAGDCRAKIPNGSTLGQAAHFVMTFCEDPDAGCRARAPLEKMNGMTMGEAELVMLIRCGARAELQAYFDRAEARFEANKNRSEAYLRGLLFGRVP
jgi:hypothetical protein